MKKLSVILLSGVVLALAGCQNQGGSRDPYNTESGKTSNTSNNGSSFAIPDDARSRINTGAGYSTNHPGRGNDDQRWTTDPTRPNNVPEN